MKTLHHTDPAPQAPARSGSEILRALQHPLALAAARLEWLAHDGEEEARDNAAFGNGCNGPFQRLRIAALRLAAEEIRSAFRCGFTPEGTGYGPALCLLNELACELEEQAEREARPCNVPRFSPAVLTQMAPPLEDQPLTVAAHAAEAALLRFAASILERETPPWLCALVA